jgi:hypothetical protein
MWKPTNAVQRSRLTYDDAMRVWRARDAYRVQTLLSSLVFLVFFLEGMTLLTGGRWAVGLLVVGTQGLALWGLCWLLRRARVWLRAWWHGLVLGLVLSGMLTGCQEYVRAVAHLYGYKGDPYASPCAPESLHVGHCVTVKQGDKP